MNILPKPFEFIVKTTEETITETLSWELSKEIDRQILDELRIFINNGKNTT